MAFTCLEREFLVVHGLSVKLRQRVRGGSKGGVNSPIYLIEARLCSFSLLTHPPKDSFVIGCERMVALLSAILKNYKKKKKKKEDWTKEGHLSRFIRNGKSEEEGFTFFVLDIQLCKLSSIDGTTMS